MIFGQFGNSARTFRSIVNGRRQNKIWWIRDPPDHLGTFSSFLGVHLEDTATWWYFRVSSSMVVHLADPRPWWYILKTKLLSDIRVLIRHISLLCYIQSIKFLGGTFTGHISLVVLLEKTAHRWNIQKTSSQVVHLEDTSHIDSLKDIQRSQILVGRIRGSSSWRDICIIQIHGRYGRASFLVVHVKNTSLSLGDIQMRQILGDTIRRSSFLHGGGCLSSESLGDIQGSQLGRTLIGTGSLVQN